MLRPCCIKAIAFNLFSFGNVLMVEKSLAIARENVLWDHIINHKWKEEPSGNDVNLLLQLKVSDENNS